MKASERKLRAVIEAKRTIRIEIRPEESSIEGNASAINDETDRGVADDIRDQLNAGNDWAWCAIRVTAEWEGFEGYDVLGCCSYESERAFIEANDYYADMVREATNDLIKNVLKVHATISSALATPSLPQPATTKGV